MGTRRFSIQKKVLPAESCFTALLTCSCFSQDVMKCSLLALVCLLVGAASAFPAQHEDEKRFLYDVDLSAFNLQKITDYLGVDPSAISIENLKKLVAKANPVELAKKLGIDTSKIDISKVDLTKLDYSKIVDVVNKVKGHITAGVQHIKDVVGDIDFSKVNLKNLVDYLGVDPSKISKDKLVALVKSLDPRKLAGYLGIDVSKVDLSKVDYTKIVELAKKLHGHIQAGASKVHGHVQDQLAKLQDIDLSKVNLKSLLDYIGVDPSKVSKEKVLEIVKKLDPRKLAGLLGIDVSKIDLSKVDLTQLDYSAITDLAKKLHGHIKAGIAHIKEHVGDIDLSKVNLQGLTDYLGIDPSKITAENVKAFLAKADPKVIAGYLGIDVSKIDLSKLDLTKLDYSKLIDVANKLKGHIQSGISKVHGHIQDIKDAIPDHCITDADCGQGECCAHLKSSKRGISDYIPDAVKDFYNKHKDDIKQGLAAGKDKLTSFSKTAVESLLKHGICLKVQGAGGDCYTIASCGCGPGLSCNKKAHFLDVLNLNFHGTCDSEV